MTPKDHIESLQHAMLVRAGLMAADSPALHPGARQHMNGSGYLIEELADFCSGLAANGRPAGAAVRVAGMSTDDFKNSLGVVLRTAVQRQLEAAQDYMHLIREVPIPNFMQQKIVSGRIDAELLEISSLDEFRDADDGALDGIPQKAQLRSFGRNVFLSRKVLVNDDVSLITSSLASYGGAAARLESRLVFDLLNSNTVLADGEPMFHADHGNLIEHADGFTEALLGQAMGALRNLYFDGMSEAQNSAPAVLAVATGLELAARKIAHQAGLDLYVTATPRISPDSWYLLPSPAVTPVIGLLRLAGSKTPLTLEPAKDRLDRDGVLYGLRCDTGVVPLSRYVVKGTKTA